MASMAGKDSPERTILLEFKDIKKVYTIKDGDKDKVSLFERVFQTHLQSSCIVSLQRYDPEWDDHVDIDIAQIRDRDKIKVLIIDNSRSSTTNETSTAGRTRHDHGVEQLISNLEDERSALDYKLSIAQATLESLKVAPRDRGVAGKYANFTCSSCHYKGHRANNCMLHPCRGYFECGQLSLHREHRDHLRQAEAEVKEIQKQLKRNVDEMENYKLLKERTRTNFFAAVRKKLQYCNPIKYSNRTTLDNDLRILATACNHRVPSNTADLETIIEEYRNKANSMKPVQSHVSHDCYANYYDGNEYQKQNVSHCKSVPITINNQWPAFTMPNSPPCYQTQSPLPHTYPRTPSPGPPSRPPYMQHTTSSLGSQSPVWRFPAGNVNYRWPNLSSARSRSPHYYSSPRGRYSSPRGRYCQKPHQTFPNHSYSSQNIQFTKTRKPNHDHLSQKRLKYDNQACKDPGRKFRESLNVLPESKTATTVGSDDETQDDETQDDSLTVSPAPKTSSAGAEATLPSLTESNDESQSFNFDSWVKKQIATSKEISEPDPQKNVPELLLQL